MPRRSKYILCYSGRCASNVRSMPMPGAGKMINCVFTSDINKESIQPKTCQVYTAVSAVCHIRSKTYYEQQVRNQRQTKMIQKNLPKEIRS